MFLAIDVGNTQTTIGLFDEEGASVHGWRMSTSRTDTSDMLDSRLHGFFSKDGLDLSSVDCAGLACVVPVLTRAWSKCLTDHLAQPPMVLTPGEWCGIDVDMPNPRSVGADRIANAVAAKRTYGAPVIVVDFGTATNIDVVDADGKYRGGAISPGLMLSASALFSRAAKLSSVPIEAPAHALGDTTETAVQSGIVVGAAAMAEGLVGRIKEELDIPEAPVIATGGLARTVSKATTLFTTVDPELTLRGIVDIYQMREERNPR
ncbi:MAG: type III pantothenate kinase [Tractidigestivibacter sp.]|jgi:type III pantothenate kinase|uniref:type III pantothenate kinase n=1 Tax=Tractidigestivibacter sp. TaxID=2847320 RepID=UPI003D916DC0